MSLRSVLLVMLSKAPNTGYGIGRLLRDELSHLWGARLQQIYSELARLDSEGLVHVESVALANRPAKKVYSLTRSGERSLDGWLADEPAPVAAKDELLVRLFCLERLPAELAVRRLLERREACEQEAAVLRTKVADTRGASREELGRRLTLEAALGRAEQQAAWCERALALLDEDTDSAEAGRPEQASRLHAAGG